MSGRGGRSLTGRKSLLVKESRAPAQQKKVAVSMADNNRTHGYRANDPYGRPRPSRRRAGDPLAELARLIGQQNELAPSYRQNGAPAGAYAQGQRIRAGPRVAKAGRSRRTIRMRRKTVYDPHAVISSPSPQAAYGGTSHDPHMRIQRYADPHYAGAESPIAAAPMASQAQAPTRTRAMRIHRSRTRDTAIRVTPTRNRVMRRRQRLSGSARLFRSALRGAVL